MTDELRALAARHPQLRVRRCVLDGPAGDDVVVGRLDEVLMREGPFTGRRVFPCGDPDLVTGLRRKVSVAGASLADIHADAFLPSRA